MNKRERKKGALFGGPTVLTVLTVLCFACFSLMALSRAASDSRLTARSAQTVAAYYTAAGTAEQIVSELAAFCAVPPDQAGPAMVQTAEQVGAQADYDAAQAELTFIVPAGTQGDFVTVLHLTASETGTVWRTLRSRLIPAQTEQADTKLPVYQ